MATVQMRDDGGSDQGSNRHDGRTGTDFRSGITGLSDVHLLLTYPYFSGTLFFFFKFAHAESWELYFMSVYVRSDNLPTYRILGSHDLFPSQFKTLF